MRNLIVALMLLVLTACGGSGGGGGGSTHVPDNTSHDYTATFYAFTNTTNHYLGTLHQVCVFGFAGFRDESSDFDLIAPSLNGGIGCAAAENYQLEAINTGVEELYLVISIDGIDQPQVIVPAGQTYTFERGF